VLFTECAPFEYTVLCIAGLSEIPQEKVRRAHTSGKKARDERLCSFVYAIQKTL
jgi:hypothetical protein